MMKRLILLTTTILFSTIAFAKSAPTITLINDYGKPLRFSINNRSTIKMLKDFKQTFVIQPEHSATSRVVLPKHFLPDYKPAAFVDVETVYERLITNKSKNPVNNAYFGVRRDGPNNADVKVSGYLDDHIGYFWNPSVNGSEIVTFHRPY